ncbi:MAG: DNA mismatch repair endonuclease MutL [Spirochaetaceae bacterium]|jgi:DNA mismatch repair protein MutL|nr:DNA mismatch repair endonuclease MutL [Spirochaetaceae bacterium]
MGIIRYLPPEEARKIAAGEVVDRPAALVREFLDNALDSGASEIETAITAGGSVCVEVNDNGSGIEHDDLPMACKTHATSKIHSLNDLASSRTLGFRGEALAAAAAVSRLEIITSTDGGAAWRCFCGPASDEAEIEPARRVKGTTVRAHRLFETIPARKRFLKRDANEALLCRQIFTEKAMAFPDRAFRFMQDGKLRAFFPAASGYRERVAQALLKTQSEAAFLHEIYAKGDGFAITVVAGGPEIHRDHRKEQFVFANGRRIADFSLQQALEYGVQGAFPNGSHPIGAIFIEVEPHLADFNVHPAKREAKFACHAEIHHAISSSLRLFFHKLIASTMRHGRADDSALNIQWDISSKAPQTAASRERQPLAVQPQSAAVQSADSACQSAARKGVRYLGTAFNLFILVEHEGRLYAIDQHAAHERILYEKLLAGPVLRQELLVPVPFSTEDASDDIFIKSHLSAFEKLGVVLRGGRGQWRIEALPALWRAGDSETVKAILELKDSGENIAERWAATIACHGALRDGEALDAESALRLAESALSLPVKCCPHGRPIVAEIKKEELLKAVRRV